MQKLFFYLSLLLVFSLNSCQSPSPFGKKSKKEYYQGGKIRSEFIMDDKTGQNGVLKEYGYDGEIKSLSHIKNAVPNGEALKYDDKGRIIQKQYFINGRENGIRTAYYPNGDIMITYNYLNGILHGEAKTYRIDGKVDRRVVYKNGKLIN